MTPKPQPTTPAYQVPTSVAQKPYEKPRPKRCTQAEVEARVQEIQDKSKLTNQIQLLIRNLRVLEVLQRQFYNDPTNTGLQEPRTAYFKSIMDIMQAAGLSVQDLKQRLIELNLLNQLANAVDYVYQNSTNVTENTKKIQRLIVDARTLCDAIKAQAVQNIQLKESLEDLLSRIQDIEGKEGCPPVNWKYSLMLRDFIKEVDQKILEHGGSIMDSYEHWVDQFENGFYISLYLQKW